jgi:uncharacterized cupredoxin-like copper-binding protein
MHHKRSISAVLGVSVLGITTWLLVAAAGPALARSTTHKASAATVVTVTAGKPSELAFKLSKFSNLPLGTVTFKVTNQGVAFHDFKVCKVAVLTTAKNACVGTTTKILKHGQSATLTIVFTKNGKYMYLCTVSGHAAAGMKGLIGIGVKVPAGGGQVAGGAATTTTTPAAAPPPPPPPPPPVAGGGGGGGGGGGDAECPAGVTIQTSGNGDQDNDELGGPSDGDGCV